MKVKLFRNAKIFTPSDRGEPLKGADQGDAVVYEKGAMLIKSGRIEAVGDEGDVLSKISHREVDLEVNCEGRCLIPGFVDPHTHMCFAVRREEEFSLRISGTEYLEILRRGGGILSSVRAVRETTEDALFERTLRQAKNALSFGTTTVEIKSGYGLDTETELKMLRVVDRIGRETPLDTVGTFMGAHAAPPEYKENPEAYVDVIVNEMLPAVQKQEIAEFCDVFCEKGVFSVEQSRRILKAAQGRGLKSKIHADEVNDLGGAALAAELKAASAEHLLAASDESLKAMAQNEVIGVLLPGTAYSLRKPYARARKMIELGVPIALATDCNPGSCYTESMPFVFGLAVLNMGLTVNEALAAATLNAAYAVGRAKQVGSLEAGKYADFILLDGQSPAIVAYHAGVSPADAVYKRGELVFSR